MSQGSFRSLYGPCLLVSCSIAALLSSCQTTQGPKPKAATQAQEPASAPVKESKPKAEVQADVDVSQNLAPVTYSMQNGAMSFHGINREKAASIAESLNGKLAKPTSKDRGNLVGLISMQSIAGLPTEELFSATRRLIEMEMAKDINKEVPEVTSLHLALAALNVRNLAMTEHFIYKIIDSTKSKRMKAAAYTIEGIIALLDERLPEAVSSWQDALKQDGEYRPALLNIGFLALRYGDFKTARANLAKLEDDFYASYGLLVAARIEGKSGEVEELCGKVLGKKAKYRPAIFSCALHEYQIKRNYKKAQAMINEMLKDGKGPALLDERAYKMLDLIGQDREAEEREKLDKKTKEPDAKDKAKDDGAKKASNKGESKGSPKESTPADEKKQ